MIVKWAQEDVETLYNLLNNKNKIRGTFQIARHYVDNVTLNGATEFIYRYARTHLTGQRYVFGTVSNSA